MGKGVSQMKKIMLAIGLSVVALSAFAQKPCDELKSKIDAKLQAKGAKGYALGVVASDQVKEEKVIGSCDGGKKKIVYKKS
jgi:predicted nucleic acid binding AN1-type Zn finger protein